MLIRTNYLLIQNEVDFPCAVEALELLNNVKGNERKFWDVLNRALNLLSSSDFSEKNFIEEVKGYIRNNYNRSDLTMEEVAEKFKLEKHYFSRKFRNEVGEKYIDFLSQMRMEEALKFAQTTDMKTADIALAVGYLDVASFRKKFSSYFGCSITEYRNNVRSKRGE